MTKREIVCVALQEEQVPLILWFIRFTLDAKQKLAEYYGSKEVDDAVGNHIIELGSDIGFYESFS